MRTMRAEVTTFGEAAADLDTTYAVIAGLVKALQITPKPVPRNGNAKGLDRQDMRALRRALKVRPQPESETHDHINSDS
jgi:hypothetical protein